MREVKKSESWEPEERYGLRSQTPRLPESPTTPSILTKEHKHKITAESLRRAGRGQTPFRETKIDHVLSSIERY